MRNSEETGSSEKSCVCEEKGTSCDGVPIGMCKMEMNMSLG